ncbi:MAG: hypothetical protein ACP5LF_06455 [Nitrososphaeria archaeon]
MSDILEQSRREFVSGMLKALPEDLKNNSQVTSLILKISERAIELDRYESPSDKGVFRNILISQDFHKGEYISTKNLLRFNIREAMDVILSSTITIITGSIHSPVGGFTAVAAIVILLHQLNKYKSVELGEAEALIVWFMHKNDAYTKNLNEDEIIEGVKKLKEDLHGGRIVDTALKSAIVKLIKLKIIKEIKPHSYILVERVRMDEQS